MLETLVASLPAFWNVGALVALLFFIYAYVGVILFGTTPRTFTSEGGSLDEHALRVLPARRADAVPRCDQRRVGGGDARLRRRRGHRPRRVPVLRELRGAGVDGDAQPVHRGDHRELRELPGPPHWKVSPNALRPFVDAFHKFDDGSGTVRGVDLERMLREIPPPLGLGGGNGSLRTRIGSTIKRAANGHGGTGHGLTKTKTHANDRPSGGGSGSMLVVHFIKSLNVPLDARGRAPFRRTAFELVRRVCECDMPPGEMRDALEHAVRRAFPDLWEPIPDEMSWAALMCVVRVQRHWRARAAARAPPPPRSGGLWRKRRRETERVSRSPAPRWRLRPGASPGPPRVGWGASSRRSAARGTRARSRTAAGLGAEASAAAAGTKAGAGAETGLTDGCSFFTDEPPAARSLPFRFLSRRRPSSRRASHAETSARRGRSASSKELSGAPPYGGGSLRRGKVAPAPAETIEP